MTTARFPTDSDAVTVLDPSDPDTAAAWNYAGGSIASGSSRSGKSRYARRLQSDLDPSRGVTGKAMKLQVFVYVCEPSGHEFQAPELPFNSYGEFLLRDETGTSLSYLNAFSDPTLAEVSGLLEATPEIGHLTARQRGRVLQRLHGEVACDPDVEGRHFHIGQHPRCQACSSTTMRSWDEVAPVDFVEVDAPLVTHVRWRLLAEGRKADAVKSWLLVNRW